MQPDQHARQQIQGRPPAAGECRFCGSTPAKKLAIQSLVGLIIAFEVTTYKGWYCRDCGLAVYRDQTVTTLKGGWWSVTGLVIAPIFLLMNLIRWVRLVRLEPPRPTPGVVGPNSRPASPGRPVFRRPVALMLVFALPFTLAIVLIMTLAITS
jgi:hypothetical protein